RPLRRVPRDLHGVLDRLGAAVDEQRLLRKRPGREPRKALRQRDVRRVWHDGETDVREPLGLVVNRSDDRRRRMTGVHDADTAGEVEKDIAVDIGHGHAVGGGREHRYRVRKPTRHRRVATPHQRARLGSGNLGAKTNQAHASVPRRWPASAGRGVLLLETYMVVNLALRQREPRQAHPPRPMGIGYHESFMKRSGSRRSGARVGLLTVSETAGILGVSPSTLRLWESVGLITPARSNGRYRLYSPELLQVLKRIKYLRDVKQLNLPGIRQMLGKTASP